MNVLRHIQFNFQLRVAGSWQT